MSLSAISSNTNSKTITFVMAFLQLVKGLLSLALVMLSASYFGAGIDRDAWVIAWSVQIMVFKLLFGPVNETFRSKFFQIKNEKGLEIALNAGYGLLLFFCAISLIIIAVFTFFPSAMVCLFAPGYKLMADKNTIGQMLQYLMPTLIFSHTITIFVAMLNTFKRFYLPEIIGIFSIVLNILLLYFFASSWGIYTLVVANYASAIILVILLFYNLRKHNYLPLKFQFKASNFLPFVYFSLPLYLFYFFAQINAWTERIFVSYLPVGSNSALDYARKFIDFPNTVIFVVATAVMTPILSMAWHQKGFKNNFYQDFYSFFRASILVISPIILLFCVCPSVLVQMLLAHGKMDVLWIAPISQTLSWFGFGLLGNIFFILSGQVLLVQQKPKTYALLGTLAQVTPIAFNYLFLANSGIQIFAITWCFSQLLFGIIMLHIAKLYNRNSVFGLLKIIFICTLAICFSYLLLQNIEDKIQWLTLFAVLFFYLFTALVLMFVFKTDESKMLLKLFKTKPKL